MLFITLFWALVACGQPTKQTSTPTPNKQHTMTDQEYWRPLSPQALTAEIDQACKTATDKKQPMLLMFSASWCGDCKKVKRLEEEAVLANELANWTTVIVDVGRLDRHQSLLKSFSVSRIAHWTAVLPNCEVPVTEYKRLRSEVFEPASNPDGVRTAQGLADWLKTARL